MILLRRKGFLGVWLLCGLIGVIALWSLASMGLLDPAVVGKGMRNTAVFLLGLFPPNIEIVPVLAGAMLETIQIALVGTLLGFCAALPLGMLGTTTLFGRGVTSPLKLLLGVIRTIPSLLWALIFVVAFGLGPAAGALGLGAYTLGYLGKLFYESFEGVDREVTEAVRSAGCNRLQLMRYALLPEAANAILSQLLFAFEYNVRASSILGFVGAGGIGFYMLGYVQLLQYQNLMTALLFTLAVVLAIDRISLHVRRRFLPQA
ncbi:MAG: phosphonate ABC transporter, permease protein PhnE [Acidobacteria bacterium]|nr:phosphonate ABC transporter, permease protein PhnE [Acidobacteriota bacterium]